MDFLVDVGIILHPGWRCSAPNWKLYFHIFLVLLNILELIIPFKLCNHPPHPIWNGLPHRCCLHFLCYGLLTIFSLFKERENEISQCVPKKKHPKTIFLLISAWIFKHINCPGSTIICTCSANNQYKLFSTHTFTTHTVYKIRCNIRYI